MVNFKMLYVSFLYVRSQHALFGGCSAGGLYKNHPPTQESHDLHSIKVHKILSYTFETLKKEKLLKKDL